MKDLYVSILGDSISTLFGYLPQGYACYYTAERRYESGVFDAGDTWWGRVLSHFGGRLLVNNSFSGSLVTRLPGQDHPSYACSDARTGGLAQGDVLPDCILIFMGTNDCGYRVPLDGADEYGFVAAYGLMLKKLRENYPAARIFCLTLPSAAGSERPSPYGEAIARVAAAHACAAIDLFTPGEGYESIDGLHPTAAGMETLARRAIAGMEQYF